MSLISFSVQWKVGKFCNNNMSPWKSCSLRSDLDQNLRKAAQTNKWKEEENGVPCPDELHESFTTMRPDSTLPDNELVSFPSSFELTHELLELDQWLADTLDETAAPSAR